MGTAYLVCATPRSGSTLLCEGLKATGLAGRPEEYFEAVAATGRPPRPEDYLRGSDDPEPLAQLGASAAPEPPPYSSLAGIASYAEHLARARRWGTTPNGVFGAKLMWDHVGELRALAAGQRDLEPLELLAELFDRPSYVWVRREDVVRQAVSLWRALQTQSWRDDSTDGPAARDAPQLRYSFAALRHLVARLNEHDARWERLLAAADAPVLQVTYEQLTSDLAGAIRRTLDQIGVRLPDGHRPAPPAMRRQADELSEAWVSAYARDVAADPDLEPLPTTT
jgi:trehalose 2-sulfotransferase